MSQQVEKSLSMILASFIGIFAIVLFISSCATTNDDTSNAVGTNDAGNDVVPPSLEDGGEQNVAVDTFEVTVSEFDEFTFYVSKGGARPLSNCIADPDVAASQWIECIVDVDELDGFMHDFTLVNTAPGDMCKYRGFESYYYQFAYVGLSPQYVTYVYDTDTRTVFSNSLRFHYTTTPNFATPWNTGGSAFPRSIDIVSEGDIKCPWDYSDEYEDGKNCCVGEYTKYAFQYNSLGFGNVLDTDAEWGGDAINCYRGPAVADSLGKDSDGFPLYHITEVVGLGFQDSYVIKAPISQNNRLFPGSNIHLYNYFSPADHLGSTTPITLQNTSPYYRFECLDANFEVSARIDVQFRDWNVNGYAEGGVAANADLSGNDPTPFEALPLNDIYDWKDLMPASRDSWFQTGNYIVEPFDVQGSD